MFIIRFFMLFLFTWLLVSCGGGGGSSSSSEVDDAEQSPSGAPSEIPLPRPVSGTPPDVGPIVPVAPVVELVPPLSPPPIQDVPENEEVPPVDPNSLEMPNIEGEEEIVMTAPVILELGPVSGAAITVYSLDGTILFTTETDSFGFFSIDVERAEFSGLESQDLVKIVSSGGVDTDFDDDGVIIESEFIDVNGEISAFVAMGALRQPISRVSVNLLTTYIVQLSSSYEEVSKDILDEIVRKVSAKDLNEDGLHSIEDLYYYSMKSSESELEKELRVLVLPHIHSGAIESDTPPVVGVSNQLLTLVRRIDDSHVVTVYPPKGSSAELRLHTKSLEQDLGQLQDIEVPDGSYLTTYICASGDCEKTEVHYFEHGKYSKGFPIELEARDVSSDLAKKFIHTMDDSNEQAVVRRLQAIQLELDEQSDAEMKLKQRLSGT